MVSIVLELDEWKLKRILVSHAICFCFKSFVGVSLPQRDEGGLNGVFHDITEGSRGHDNDNATAAAAAAAANNRTIRGRRRPSSVTRRGEQT